MSVDLDTIKRVSLLSRIAISDQEARELEKSLNNILEFVEQLNEVDVTGVDPMTSVVSVEMRKRVDEINTGNEAEKILSNAPVSEDNFFLVPKVVE